MTTLAACGKTWLAPKFLKTPLQRGFYIEIALVHNNSPHAGVMHCQYPQRIRENLKITCSSGKKQNVADNTVPRTAPGLIDKPQMALPTPLIYTPRHRIVTCGKTPMPTYTDNHCHLNWFSDPTATARKAREAGVCRIVIAAATRVLGGCASATPIGNSPSQPRPAPPLSGHQGGPNHPAHPAFVAANLVHQRGESPNPIRRQSEENRNAFFVWKTA